MSAAAKPGPIELLLFRVSSRRCAVRCSLVQQVVRAATLTAAAVSRPEVMGLLNLRGQVVPVVDLRRLLNSEATSLQPDEHLIVVRVGEQCLALRVDRAEGLTHVRTQEISSAEGAWADCEAVAGIVNVDAELVLLLEPNKLFIGVTSEPAARSPEVL